MALRQEGEETQIATAASAGRLAFYLKPPSAPIFFLEEASLAAAPTLGAAPAWPSGASHVGGAAWIPASPGATNVVLPDKLLRSHN